MAGTSRFKVYRVEPDKESLAIDEMGWILPRKTSIEGLVDEQVGGNPGRWRRKLRRLVSREKGDDASESRGQSEVSPGRDGC